MISMIVKFELWLESVTKIWTAWFQVNVDFMKGVAFNKGKEFKGKIIFKTEDMT